MTTPLQTLVEAGTTLWVDSVDPAEIARFKDVGASGATSNPIIIADLIKSGRFDDAIQHFAAQGLSDADVAWAVTDKLVNDIQGVFKPVWDQTQGNDGWVSFELDPLLEDHDAPAIAERTAQYIELGKKWAEGHSNRMIKVPATPAGLACLEELAAAGVALNVTLIFSERQYIEARDAVWRGAQRAANPLALKSVYSIFVSRVDVYTEKTYPQLSADAQGQVGIVNAKRIYQLNKAFWADKGLPKQQQMIFASTGTKKPEDPADKYVASFAGDDIQTNPPATNAKVQELGQTYSSQVNDLPAQNVLEEIDQTIDFAKLEADLMTEGLAKFAEPQKALIALIGEKRAELTTSA